MEDLAVSLPIQAPRAPAATEGAEAQLLERARAGHEDAFRILVERHRDRAYGLALRITRSPADAEDAAQEAFVRAWLALPRFRGDASFGTWLHRIVARRALDRSMAARRREARETGLEAAERVADTAGDERDLLLARRLERLMDRLSAPQRAVVALFYQEDQSVEHIASALDMPESTVKTHLSRARAALREAWLAQEGDPR